jgi:branched-chain amino acid transport system substrate-binding protein
MSDKKLKITQKNTIVFIYVLILCLLGPLIVILNNSSFSVPDKLKARLEPFLGDKKETSSDQVKPTSLQNRISEGDRILISANTNTNKQTAIQAYVAEDYQTALDKFQASLRVQANDPEALIYWNNSLANLKGNPLKLATSVPIGGNLDLAKEILRGVAQAQTQINRNGGIDGRLVEIEIANDDNDPLIAKQIATELVKDETVMAVIGHNDSDASIAAAPIYQQGKLVMITPTSSAENLSEVGNYIFRAAPNARLLSENLANYTVDIARKKNIGICVDSKSGASKSLQKEFAYAVYSRGAKITSTVCDFSAPNFNPSDIPSQMISGGADSIVLLGSIRTLNQAISVIQANQGRLTLLGNHSLNTYSTLQQGQKEANGMVLTVAWHPKEKTNKTFVHDAQKLWGGEVNWRSAMAYDASMAVFNAISADSTREQVQMTLSNPLFKTEGANESIQFLPSGDRNMKGALVKIEPGNKSGTGYDFVLFEPKAGK